MDQHCRRVVEKRLIVRRKRRSWLGAWFNWLTWWRRPNHVVIRYSRTQPHVTSPALPAPQQPVAQADRVMSRDEMAAHAMRALIPLYAPPSLSPSAEGQRERVCIDAYAYADRMKLCSKRKV